MLDPRLLLRSEYVGRIALSLAMFVALGFVFEEVEPYDRLITTMLLVSAGVFTAISAAWSEFQTRALNDTFLGGQILFDLVLVTGLVHVTGGAASQFAALYILVIAVAALMLTASAGLLVAALACVLYFADVILAHRSSLDLGHWLQLGVFAGVALSSGYIASRLREARAGREELAAELVKVRLQAEDILRNIRSGIVTVDAGGHLVYANPAASSLLGLDLNRGVGQRVRELFGGISPELVNALEQAAESGIRTIRAEGRVLNETRGFPIGLNTTVTASAEQPSADNGDDPRWTATAIFQDLTDQKRLDALRRRTQRLEAVTELSASLAHEIKNPLASIRSAVEQLGHSKRATPDEQTLSSLIVRESDRLSRLLTEFLDFARVRVSRVQKVDIGKVVHEAATLAAAHPSRAEGVSVAISNGAAGSVEGDDDVLHRAVFNLVLNAVQLSPQGGEVRVEVTSLRPEDAPPGVRLSGGGVSIRIADDGPGIPPEARERMFDPFFTTRPGGSGLGLAVVHRAVESHAGCVFVDSEVGSGTRVTVLLPRQHDQAVEAS